MRLIINMGCVNAVLIEKIRLVLDSKDCEVVRQYIIKHPNQDKYFYQEKVNTSEHSVEDCLQYLYISNEINYEDEKITIKRYLYKAK